MVLPATLDPSGPLDDSMGVFYIGILISAVLYGFCLLQAFIYFQKFSRDPWFTKTAVVTLVIFDTSHLIFVAMGVYHYLITNYHTPSKLQDLTWPILMEAAFVIANSTIVQLFYIYRVWLLCKHKITSILLCGFFLLLVCGEAGVVTGKLLQSFRTRWLLISYFPVYSAWLILAMQMEKWRDLFKIIPLATAILGLSCSIDVLISGTLCILLYLARTGFKRSDSMINRLILFIISTGSLTAIFAVVALICLFAIPYSLTYGALYQCIGYRVLTPLAPSVYTNSFLTTLNRRSTVNIVEGTELKSTRIVFQERTMGNLQETLSDTTDDKTTTQRMGESTTVRAGGGNSDPAQQSHFFGDFA